MKRFLSILLLALPLVANAQISNDDVHKYDELNRSGIRRDIVIPGFDGYQTLKCDFHIHTVFSDGAVWPTIRVQEAWREGLDVIAITDHIEYKPFRRIVKADHDKSYEIAAEEAQHYDLIVIKGAEITRSKPLGHLNALFITDADKLDVGNERKAIKAALKQDAYIIWNHPGWPDNKSTVYPIHEELINEGSIHAYELYNYMESYPLTFDWYAEYGIAPMANSDIHGLIEADYGHGRNWMRPMTLVFAEERNQAGVREALDAGRTLAFFHGNLVGNAEYLTKLIDASLEIAELPEGMMEVKNFSDISYVMSQGETEYVFPAQSTVVIAAPVGKMTVNNCMWGHKKYLEYELK